MKFLFLFLLIFLISAFPQNQNIKKVKLYINNNTDLQKADLYSIDLEHSASEKKNERILFADEFELSMIVASGLNYEILIDDWFSYYNSLPKLTENEKEIIKMESSQKYDVSGFGFGSMGGYYTFDEITANLDSMHAQFPDIISEKFSIGTTWEGRDIWAVRISDNPNVNENEPTVGLDALIHAREPQSMATLMYFMWYLLENYGTDPRATYLVNNREIYCIPCFNPDGYEYNHQTNPAGGGQWRKNRRNNGGSYGVDLNRNFGYAWGYDDIGSNPDPSSQTYRGPSAFSEPETQAVRDFAILNRYGTHFNMHTYGNDILYPWGYIDAETPDSLTYREFGSDISSLNGYAVGTGFQLLGYPSNGATRDWMYGEQSVKNKIYSYTIEIGSSIYNFWPPQSQIFPIAQQNVTALMYQCFVAGEYVQMSKPNFDKEYFLPNDFVSLTPEFRNKGLATAHNLTFELSSPSQYITVNTGNASLDSIEARSSANIQNSLTFTISGSAPVNEEIPIVLTTRINGDFLSGDTTEIIIGYPVYIFQDTTNDPNVLWTITATPTVPRWEATTEDFYSPPTSFTDSKNQNYSNNATVTMSLTNPVDINSSHPRLIYRTRFDIEANYDYGQIKISTNNGTNWIAVAGKYTEPGVSPQPVGQPVYDGTILNWVKEDIDLTNYQSSQFKLQFFLKSDGGITRDGWYLDDIGVLYYTIPVGLQTESETVYKFSLDQNYPNPFNPVTKINFTISESGFTTLKIYDVLGNEITTLVNEVKTAGSYSAEFNAKDLPSGVYFYKLKAGDFVATKKMLLLK